MAERRKRWIRTCASLFLLFGILPLVLFFFLVIHFRFFARSPAPASRG